MPLKKIIALLRNIFRINSLFIKMSLSLEVSECKTLRKLHAVTFLVALVKL